VAHSVFLHPLAAEDLNAIDDYIARDSPVRAHAFVARLKARCESLADFPYKGRARPDIAEGLRTLSFQRRVVIAYEVDGDQVTIWRIIVAGQDLEEVLEDLKTDPR
jgi:toxin ParE1/3/4